MHLEEDLRNYFLTHVVSGKNVGMLDDDDLVEDGILDSIAFIGLITHLEEVYRIEVKASEMITENFGSIRRLADFVQSKLGNQ